MATVDDFKQLRLKLEKKKYKAQDIDKAMEYLMSTIREEEAKFQRDKSKTGAVRQNSVDQLFSLFVKYQNLGLVLDGVNVVVTGRNMAMPTYHGYKNKVLQNYPDATFDVQLVREGDTFKFAKENGRVIYTHEFGDPFTETAIKGAYCVITIGEQDYFEALNPTDFDKMKKSSKQQYLWGEWASEFWLKSVLKRACKRHFHDITSELDRVDNDDYGAGPPSENELGAVLQDIKTAGDLATLKTYVSALSHEMQLEVVEAARVRASELTGDIE